MEIFPDPIVERFVDGRSYRSGDYLTINGKYLDAAASERDVQVKIGDELCNLTALANRALTCLPPDPTISNQLQYNDKPRVIVKIGGMNYDVGELVYNSKESDISPQVLIAISVAILGVIVAFILLLVFYRRKSTSHMREMKHLRNQIDQIEMKV
ncbi:unnamed protein product, partial [Anisakis simplex]|uniref:IPT/TIG domain-containing protein n=1 Tax=Anisakis simplex TaxID=6269 RepID=A0A0M3JBS6_ANISI